MPCPRDERAGGYNSGLGGYNSGLGGYSPRDERAGGYNSGFGGYNSGLGGYSPRDERAGGVSGDGRRAMGVWDPLGIPGAITISQPAIHSHSHTLIPIFSNSMDPMMRRPRGCSLLSDADVATICAMGPPTGRSSR